MSGPPPSGWLIDRRVDLALVGVPLALTGAFLLTPAPDDLPLWAFLFLIVAFDVAHVWSTLYLGYLDERERRRRPLLFFVPIPLTVLACFRLHQHSPVLLWTVVAYVAIHHFAAQQYGFVALYKLRAGERDRFDRVLDRWTLWAGALGPVLLWHTGERFDWFGHGEQFLFRLDPALRPDIVAVMATFAVVYGARQVVHARAGRFNLGKNVWMAASWLSWSLGLAVDHPLVALACINLLHGIPFLALVWVRARRARVARGEPLGSGDLQGWLVGRWWAFYGLVLVLALAEEGAWEGLVWGHYLPRVELPSEATSLAVALLATPQIVHYFLDGWLWKLDGTNPDLDLALGVSPRSAAPASAGPRTPPRSS